MAYSDQTFVSFTDEDIPSYELMRGWNDSTGLSFNFLDSLDFELDGLAPDAIREGMRERLKSIRQVLVLVGEQTRSASVRPSRLHYELDTIRRAELPVVFVNLSGSRRVQNGQIPRSLSNQYTISVAFGPRVVRYALDDFVSEYARLRQSESTPHAYEEHVYTRMVL